MSEKVGEILFCIKVISPKRLHSGSIHAIPSHTILPMFPMISRWEYTAGAIHTSLAEGHSVDDFMTVIDHKCAEWLGSGMAQYLRPQTLFGTKFEGYLNAPDYTTICYQNRQQNTQEAPVERDYSTNMIDLLNEYLGE